MKTKISGSAKLVLITEPIFFVLALIVFYLLRNKLQMLDLVWLWTAIILFSAASFLFLLVLFVITIAKSGLRITYWPPILFVGFFVFLFIALLMYMIPSLIQPVIVEAPGQEVITEEPEYPQEEKEEETKYQQVETETVSEPKELQIYNIGDLVEVGNIEVKVNGVRTLGEKDEWDKQTEEGYIYLLVDVLIENIGNQETYIDTFSGFRLVDKDGRKYKTVWPSAAKGSVEGLLGPGRKIAGEMGYGIPDDIKEFEMEIFEIDRE